MSSNPPEGGSGTLVPGCSVVVKWSDGKTYDAIVTDLRDAGAEKPVQMRFLNRKTPH